MKRLRIHIYPPYTGTKADPGNIYSKLLWKSFENDDKFSLAYRRLLGKPLWDLAINVDADVFIFSWIEGFAINFTGKVKLLYLFLFICTVRILRKKVVWILHNKHPHSRKTISSDIAMKLLAKLASHVITHASDGLGYFEKSLGGKHGKCFYIPHPVYTDKIFESKGIKWDFIIWGEVSRRKGVMEFLKFASSSPYFVDKRILICGRCKDNEYSKQISELCRKNFVYENAFIPDLKLQDYILSSRCILFTYHSDSVLSSGALVYSLNFCKPILAPAVGAFRDMDGAVTCYNSFEDIPSLSLKFEEDRLKEYIYSNTWDRFPAKLLRTLKPTE